MRDIVVEKLESRALFRGVMIGLRISWIQMPRLWQGGVILPLVVFALLLGLIEVQDHIQFQIAANTRLDCPLLSCD